MNWQHWTIFKHWGTSNCNVRPLYSRERPIIWWVASTWSAIFRVVGLNLPSQNQNSWKLQTPTKTHTKKYIYQPACPKLKLKHGWSHPFIRCCYFGRPYRFFSRVVSLFRLESPKDSWHLGCTLHAFGTGAQAGDVVEGPGPSSSPGISWWWNTWCRGWSRIFQEKWHQSSSLGCLFFKNKSYFFKKNFPFVSKLFRICLDDLFFWG